jgi:hypothetical protein
MSDLRGQHKSFGVHKQASVHGWSNQYTIGEESYRLGQKGQVRSYDSAQNRKLTYNRRMLQLHHNH